MEATSSSSFPNYSQSSQLAMGDDHSLGSSQLSDVSSAAVNKNAAVSGLRFVEDSDLDLTLSISNKRNKKIGSSSKAKHLEPRVYACDFCKKKFPTCQALGGHQNGHKMEREMMKQRRRVLGQDHKHYNPTALNFNKLSAIHHHNTFIRSNTNILNTMSSTRRCDLSSRNLIDTFRAAEDKPTAAADDGIDLNLKL